MQKWSLITEWYWPSDYQRQRELRRALSENIECDAIEKIVLFKESDEGLDFINKNTKIESITPSSRPTFNQLVSFSAKQLSSRNVVLANGDISFLSFNNFVPEERTVYSCTRHEIIEGAEVWFDDTHPLKNHHERSQDAWFFKSGTKLRGGHFVMGTPGCDSRVNWLFQESGNAVLNIGRQVRLRHYHEDTSRNYSNRMLPTPRLYVNDSGLNSVIFHMKIPFSNNNSLSHQKRKLKDWDFFRSLFASPWEFFFTSRFYLHRANSRLFRMIKKL